MDKCINVIDEFICDYKLDDEAYVPEEERKFLFDINYPSAKELLKNHPNCFCKLLLDYRDSLINVPYIDTPYFKGRRKNILHGFAINKIDEIEIEGDQIVLKGIGYYF